MPLNALHDVPAPAKLNLFLHIVGRRADGMHLLQSPFVLIDWADTLHFERRADRRVHRHDLSHDLSRTLPEDDLCVRAARALQVASGCAQGVDIGLDKRLPTGAGMGGGSSDAATVLLALNRLWGLNWPRSALSRIGLQLGADVPFFIGGHNAFVEGIGERLTPLVCPPMRFAVVKPTASLSTADVFHHPALVRNTEVVIVAGLSQRAEVVESSGAIVPGHADSFGRNDLQPPAEDRCPQVADVAEWLKDRFGNSRMTGSGSAVFARLKPTSDGFADLPAEALAPGWVGRICHSLTQHPLLGWAD